MPDNEIRQNRSITVWSPTNKEMIIEIDALDAGLHDYDKDCQTTANQLAKALGLRVTVVDQEIGSADPHKTLNEE